ncbi:hypothetical protein C2E21_0090 [Chlorella sorokiniana]|uniref:Uncharacterized protein n=1 Tax=Chlorella sorokiniana TaxID=3076 RepID=A0A2P6U3I6_CHLSO|nr:hypothetical protein C2E21_0090 [Chlorella sorokiniana]|eukprot:PRW60878.1 hypothetical protein C2E21_0090 [Chlorella sorokiniana]
MLRPFANAQLEEQYQRTRREHLSTLDMRAAVAFIGLWLYDLLRFAGVTPLSGLLKATVWLAAVGMKPVYVYAIVGRDFYQQFRVWIISFTKPAFPAGLDPCLLLGAWGALCSFLLTTLWLAVAERRARSEFGRRHRHRLAAEEQELVEQGSSPVWAWGGAALLFAYICLLLWQVLLVVYSWAGRGGKLPFLMGGTSPMDSSSAFAEASLVSRHKATAGAGDTMASRWIGALGLLLALAAGSADARRDGSEQAMPSIRLTCKPDLVQAVLPGGRSAAAVSAASSGSARPGSSWVTPDSLRHYGGGGHSSGGRGQQCGWNPKPRWNVGLTFPGLNVLEQALANDGSSWEIPGQGLCVGNGVVLQAVNSAIRLHSVKNGAPLGPAAPLNAFMGLPGGRLYNPTCQFDAATRRWFLAASASERGVALSVSMTADPSKGWRHFVMAPPVPLALPAYRIPWLAVYPEAVVVSGVLNNGSTALGYDRLGSFVHAISKAELLSGPASRVPGCYANASALPNTAAASDVVPAQQLAPEWQHMGAAQPIPLLATAPDRANPSASVTNLPVYMLRLPSGRNLASPGAVATLSLQSVGLPAKAAYRMPPPAAQPSSLVPPRGFTNYGISQPYRLDALEARMQSVVAHGARVFATWGSAVSQGATDYAGVAWAVLDVGWHGVARVADAGLLGLKGSSLLAPAIAVAHEGRFAAISVTAVDGSATFPSSAFISLSVSHSGRSTAGDVVMLARGVGPIDGFTGYITPNRVGRFGDYNAAAVDPSNPCNIWVATEFVAQYCTPQQYQATSGAARCNGTRTAGGNWATQISQLRAPGCWRSG